ncbi:MAG: PEP/pyruvate-binding domain-containing protein [Spirochaetia bacterium]|jgi:pyruvate,water dikinase|nr:PEP/pyruvate-binding domain-containing protein [Spirochaetia bacterium]
MIWNIDTDEPLNAETVGGKGLSLALATRAGLRVPEGCLIGSTFFEPWIKLLRQEDAWKGLSSKREEEITEACGLLKQKAMRLALDAERSRLLIESLRGIFGASLPPLAVRSSSPEEDGSGSSFAGAYESILGVVEAGLTEALRRVFSSCLDGRIVAYKRQRGFDPTDIRMAAVIQHLIRADRAGVAFSANPLDNDLDEVLINASFGLGESIVAGTVSPDTYIFDRVKDRIIEQRLGRKEIGIFANSEGGTERNSVGNPMSYCLGEGEAREVAALSIRAEELLGRPADIEWAFEGDTLYLLQARPITTLFALPPSMITRPGEPRRLYLDFTLVGQGVRRPLSILGNEFYSMIQDSSTKSLIGIDLPGLEEGFFGGVEGRSFLNVSNVLKVPGGMFFAKKLSREDHIVLAILDGLSSRAYRTPGKPAKLKGFLLKAIKATKRYSGLKRQAYQDPRGYRAFFLEECRRRSDELDRLEAESTGLCELAANFVSWFSDFLVSLSLAMTTASHGMALASIRKRFKSRGPTFQEALSRLERGLPDNNTVIMGLELEALAARESFRRYESYDQWLSATRSGDVRAEDRKAFDRYLESFGFRCPVEIDLATRRPAEDPATFYESVRRRALLDTDRDFGSAQFEKAAREREAARDFLMAALPPGRARDAFRHDYEVLVVLGGYREIHKHYLILATARLRAKVLALGRIFAEEARLDESRDIFDLTFAQIDEAARNPGADLRVMARANLAWRKNWESVRDFPALVDSRGKILRPTPTDAADGEFRGLGISPGVAEGRIKVLTEPDEKPLLPGEVLVARAADPGWNGLFVPAAAVILEIGGPTQHGAVVAREYGKPCVAGIERATELFRDGDLVCVDGATGSVRILRRSEAVID